MKKEIAGRLQEALGDRNITAVQEALEERGVHGSSYANVYAYFKGRTRQSVEFLNAVAEELGVSPAWLAFGPEIAARTQEEARAREAAELAQEEVGAVSLAAEPRGTDLRDRVVEGLGLSEHPHVLPYWVPALAEVERRAADSPLLDMARRLEGQEAVELPPVDLVAALRGPTEAFGLDPEHLPDPGGYIASMIPVLLSLAEERNRQRWAKATENPDQEDEDAS